MRLISHPILALRLAEQCLKMGHNQQAQSVINMATGAINEEDDDRGQVLGDALYALAVALHSEKTHDGARGAYKSASKLRSGLLKAEFGLAPVKLAK